MKKRRANERRKTLKRGVIADGCGSKRARSPLIGLGAGLISDESVMMGKGTVGIDRKLLRHTRETTRNKKGARMGAHCAAFQPPFVLDVARI